MCFPNGHSLPSSNGYFQQDNDPCHKVKVSNFFDEYDKEFSELHRPPQSPVLDPVEHLQDVAEQEIGSINAQLTKLQKLCDASCQHGLESQESFQNLVESRPRGTEAG